MASSIYSVNARYSFLRPQYSLTLLLNHSWSVVVDQPSLLICLPDKRICMLHMSYGTVQKLRNSQRGKGVDNFIIYRHIHFKRGGGIL